MYLCIIYIKKKSTSAYMCMRKRERRERTCQHPQRKQEREENNQSLQNKYYTHKHVSHPQFLHLSMLFHVQNSQPKPRLRLQPPLLGSSSAPTPPPSICRFPQYIDSPTGIHWGSLKQPQTSHGSRFGAWPFVQPTNNLERERGERQNLLFSS